MKAFWGAEMQGRHRNKRAVTREQIEKRAYEIYLQRGGMDGTDMEDWLVAEHELLGEEGLSGGADGERTPLPTRRPSSTESGTRDEASAPEEKQRRSAAAGRRSSR